MRTLILAGLLGCMAACTFGKLRSGLGGRAQVPGAGLGGAVRLLTVAALLAAACGHVTAPTPESVQQTVKRYTDPARGSARPLAAAAAVEGLRRAAEGAGVVPYCDVLQGPAESAVIHCEIPAGDAADALLQGLSQ